MSIVVALGDDGAALPEPPDRPGLAAPALRGRLLRYRRELLLDLMESGRPPLAGSAQATVAPRPVPRPVPVIVEVAAPAPDGRETELVRLRHERAVLQRTIATLIARLPEDSPTP